MPWNTNLAKMRRIVKSDASEIKTLGLSYTTESHKPRISQILKKEQFDLCAYTEERISPAFAKEIEHFNPHLKGTASDGYENWYLASSFWNKRKGTRNAKPRWDTHQTVVAPSDATIDNRFIYDASSGAIIESNSNDDEAKRTVKYLFLDDPDLSKDRLGYINRLQSLLDDWNGDIEKLKSYLKKHNNDIRYTKAVQTVFQFDPILECLQTQYPNNRT